MERNASIWSRLLNLANGQARQQSQIASILGAALVYTGNGDNPIATAFTPNAAGKLLCVAVIVPEVSGLVFVSANFEISSTAPDNPEIVLYQLSDVGAVTGGTPLNNTNPTGAITLEPASTTPPYNTNPPMISMISGSTGADVGSVSFASVPTQLTPGVPCALAFYAISSENGITWSVTGTISIIEKP